MCDDEGRNRTTTYLSSLLVMWCDATHTRANLTTHTARSEATVNIPGTREVGHVIRSCGGRYVQVVRYRVRGARLRELGRPAIC